MLSIMLQLAHLSCVLLTSTLPAFGNYAPFLLCRIIFERIRTEGRMLRRTLAVSSVSKISSPYSQTGEASLSRRPGQQRRTSCSSRMSKRQLAVRVSGVETIGPPRVAAPKPSCIHSSAVSWCGNTQSEDGKALQDVRDTIIIGSGPAGYTAALYTARAQMRPLMVAGFQWGGQLQLTSDVENFPGYAEAISGPDLMEDLRKQAERFGTEMLYRDVTSIDVSRRPFKVSIRKKDVFARSLIIATGAEAIWLGAEGEEEVRGKGVSTCATCDGAFYEGKEVVVVGGGDSAMEEALFLTKFASKVTLVHRRAGFRSSKIMLQRVEDHPKIELKLHRVVKRWVSEGGVLVGAELEDPQRESSDGGATDFLPCSGAFLAIGHKPMTKFLGNAIELDDDGFIVHKEHTMSSVEGVFACGDVVDRRYRQAISAAGMGCQAAIDCERWLAEEQ